MTDSDPLDLLDRQEILDGDLIACVVADYAMPNFNGLELFNRLRQSGCPFPVLLRTGHENLSLCRETLRAGVYDYVLKSEPMHRIIASVSEAIELDRRRQRHYREQLTLRQKFDELTMKEEQVARLLCEGLRLKHVAERLNITVQTASKHRVRGFTKVGVDNEVQLLRYLQQAGLHS